MILVLPEMSNKLYVLLHLYFILLTDSKGNKDKDDKNIGQVQGNVNNVEEEILRITAKFNQDLSEDPNSIETWKNYVKFQVSKVKSEVPTYKYSSNLQCGILLKVSLFHYQDVVHQFERVYRRGGGATGARVTAERKLSILDKALKENSMCEELLKERCQLAESVLPSDKVK